MTCWVDSSLNQVQYGVYMLGLKQQHTIKKNVSRKNMDAGKIRFTDVFSKNLNKCIDYFTNILLNESNYPKYQNYA